MCHVCRNCNVSVALLKSGLLAAPRLPIVFARFCLRCLFHASEQQVRSDMERERMLTSEAPVLWWEPWRDCGKPEAATRVPQPARLAGRIWGHRPEGGRRLPANVVVARNGTHR